MYNDKDEDLSFVVLGTSSMQSYSNGDLSADPVTASQNPSLQSLGSGVQLRLDQIIKENCDLRDTLNKTNLAMKNQFGTLAQWQQDVLKAHKIHREKFAETRDLVLNLKTENAALKIKVAEVTSLKFENDALKRKLEAQQQCALTPESSFDMRDKVTKLSMRYGQLSSNNSILIRERDAFKEECSRLTDKIHQLDDMLRKVTEENNIIWGNYQSLKYESEEIALSHRDSSILQVSFAENLRCGENINEDITKRAIGSHPDSITHPQEQLCTEMVSTAQLQKELSIVKDESQRLCDEKNSIISELESQLSVSNAEVQKLKKELQQKEILVSSAVNQLKEERERVDKGEEISVLKAQVEVYKNDYKEERSARERIVEEKENLAEEVRILKDKLGRLESDLVSSRTQVPHAELLPLSATDVPPPPTQVVHQDAAAVASAPENDMFECPVCEKKFNLDDLQRQQHVNNCLDAILPSAPALAPAAPSSAPVRGSRGYGHLSQEMGYD